MRAHLPIAKNAGLLVAEIVPSSPADGKLHQFDVIVKAGDKMLQSPVDLVRAVDAVKGAAIPLEVLRGGKTLRIEVTPVKRPPQADQEALSTIVEPLPGVDSQAVARALEWLSRSQTPGGPVQLFAMRPGWVLRPGGRMEPLEALPANLTISVTREGAKPATIVVRRGDQKWEIAENELDTLPADIRPYAERMLGRGPNQIMAESLVRPPVAQTVPSPSSIAPQARLDKQLDEMRQQIEQLRKTLDEMRAQQDNAKK